tara:strand:+ start:2812 stop:3693 length:882 start_codon:yes stop_codon:yes gene_type:complete
MATLNLGRIKPVFRGAYSGSTAYVVDDIVTHGNESFICIQAHGAGTQATSQTAYWTKLAAKGTDGTDVGTTITTQGDLLYRDGSGLQRLAKPASDMYLKNTSAGAVQWSALSSDFVKIAGGSTTASNYIDITGCFSTDYKLYKLLINFTFDGGNYLEVGLLKASDNSLDGGDYYVRANGEYSDSSSGNSRWTGGANQNTYNQSDNQGFRVVNTWQNNYSSEHSMTEMTLDNPIATRKTMIQHTTIWSQSNYVGQSHGQGMIDNTNSHSGIRLGASGSSNFTTTGYYAIYGLKN